MTAQLLVVAAVCFRDAADRILTVRKRGTDTFMLPGGKLEPGEAPCSAALREVHEELDVAITKEDLALFGRWNVAAANELDTWIDATIYISPASISPVACGEIAELRWVDPAARAESALQLAPLLRECVFPALAA